MQSAVWVHKIVHGTWKIVNIKMTQEQCDIFNSRLVGTMNHTLGIRFLPTDDESVLAEMPINENTVQYFGILHGGAALAMAETLAGAGSLAIVGEDARICGLQVSGNHVGMSAKEGKVIMQFDD